MAEYSLKDKAYRLIKQNIIHCVYMPNTVLSEAELMATVDASRTPIREALNKLEHEHLIRILPKRGAVVADISISEVSMIFEARLHTEPYILRNFLQNVDRAPLEEILRQMLAAPLDEEHYEKIYSMDDLLHRILCNACPNPYIRDPMGHILDQSNRLRILAGKNIHGRQFSATQEHIALLRAVLAGNAEEAAGLLTEHLNNSRDAAIRSLLDSDMSTSFPALRL